MKVYKVNNQKDFSTKLFVEDTFDKFLVVEADFVKGFSIFIDGHKTSDPDGTDEYVSWREVKEQALSAIKGKELPKTFKIVLKLSRENTANTLKALELPDDAGTGLYMNIKYAEEQMTIISGTSVATFSISKDLDHGWEHFLEKFFEKKSIDIEEM